MDEPPLPAHRRPLTVLLFSFLLTHVCRGESQLIGPSQPIVAALGDDVLLPCHLSPAMDASGLTLEWTRPDLDPRFVYVQRSGLELADKKHRWFEGRTRMFADEVKLGNISLKLSNVRFSDEGKYRCYVPSLGKESFTQLVVASDAVSPPVVTFAGLDTDSGSVELQCESAGWYPEPEVLWLDGEGNRLPAGPTETLRGPDDLYTVSSRVTVDKRHSNNITCRVQQLRTNQSSETQIHVPDDFFVSSPADPVIIVLAVCLVVCIVVILTGVFFVWRANKARRNHCEESGERKKKKHNKTEKTEEGGEEEIRMIEDVPMEELRQKHQTQSLGDRLIEMNKQHQAEQQQLRSDHGKEEEDNRSFEMVTEEEVKDAETQREVHNNQSEGNQTIAAGQSSFFPFSLFSRNSNNQLQTEQQRRITAEREVDSLKKKLNDLQKQLDTKTKELENKQEADNNKWKETNDELKEAKTQLNQKGEEINKLKGDLERLRWDKCQMEEKLKNNLITLNMEWKKVFQKEGRMENAEEMGKLAEELYNKSETQRNEDPDLQGNFRVEVDDKHCKYIRLNNEYKQDKALGGCRLILQISNREPIMFTFDESVKVQSGGSVTLWRPGCVSNNPSAGDLVWKDLRFWRSGDRLQISFISNSGDIKLL